MNNSFLRLEEKSEENTEFLREKEAAFVRIVEALKAVAGSNDWRTLKELIFDDLVESLERRLSTEAKKDVPNQLELRALSAQLAWAKKYADLETLADVYRVQVTTIRKQLNG